MIGKMDERGIEEAEICVPEGISEVQEFFVDRDFNGKFVTSFRTFVDRNTAKDGIMRVCGVKTPQGWGYNRIYLPMKRTESTRKSVLLVSHEMSRTGAPIVLLDTAKILLRNGYFVVTVTPEIGPLIKEFLEIGVPVVLMPELEEMKFYKSELMHFVDRMDLDVFVNNFDLTIMNTMVMCNFVKRYFNTGNKIIWWLHEGSTLYDDEGYKARMPKNITPNIRVVCAGDYALNILRDHGYRYHASVLNYGVEQEKVEDDREGAKKDLIRFIMVGSIDERKGQRLLLKAIANLPKEYNERAEFMFVGSANFFDHYGTLTENEIKDYSRMHKNVRIMPFMSREKVLKLYRDSDVLVVPSYDDPMPVVATENFMLKKPVLCSTATGTSYYIKDGVNGFVFDWGDEVELADKIKYIVDHKDELNNVGEKGREIYEDFFTMKAFERNLLKIVREEEVK